MVVFNPALRIAEPLCEILQTAGLDSVRVDSLPNGDEISDKDIIMHSDLQDWIEITKDSDFYHSQ